MPRCVLITGSRGWTDIDAICDVLQSYEMVVVGCSRRGADHITREQAVGLGCMPPKVFYARWQLPNGKRDKLAGFARNQRMVDFCAALRADGIEVHCHAFWLGSSPGTGDCISRATLADLPLTIHRGYG